MFEEHYEFRSGLVDALRRDLLGPTSEHETIEDPPITRYVTGILYPNDGAVLDAGEDLEEEDELESSEDGVSDPSVAVANVRYPSTIGMTFAVDTRHAPDLRVGVSIARYQAVANPGDSSRGEEGGDTAVVSGRGRRGGHPRLPWQRAPLELEPAVISATDADDHRIELTEGLELRCRVRPADTDGIASVTTILVNTHSVPTGELRDAYSWFQPRIDIEGAVAGGAPLVVRRGVVGQFADDDVRSFELLYRDAASMAVGHGCSVDWEPLATDPSRAVRVWTEILPEVEVPSSASNPAIPTDGLSMRTLAEGDRQSVLQALAELCRGYEDWIDARRDEAQFVSSEHTSTAEKHLAECDRVLDRMRSGILTLERDSDAWEAFRLANSAMLMQRTRSEWLASSPDPGDPVPDINPTWYPFQIAFVLLCLEGIADPTCDDRELCDLLWFPTGGGKTEAYMGLLAFAIILRRLRDPELGHGVTAVMRYTLRLLTIQQFERATLLICCLERIRASDARLGSSPIEIGLWVGQAATPNDLKTTQIQIKKLQQGSTPTEKNPLQLSRCPWCATPLTPRSLTIATTRPRLVTSCGNRACEFTDELPIRVVDEDIYERHPALLIATADKFASMPWLEKAASIFNRDLPGVSPPELIIQDELHLISGPLGTLVGLYETAIDLLCSTPEGVGPKVVASTATIRRADEQTVGLFARRAVQFPPPGLIAGDSYFAATAQRERRAARLYMGLCAPGKSHAALLVRTYACMLQQTADLPAVEPSIRDPYWTLVGYFNSLRVLGAARIQVQDDVSDRMLQLAEQSGTDRRDIEHRIELTSREPSTDIPDHLRRMSIEYPDPEALAVIFATNMISVGVDINRLGLMTVMGQPQSTAEYIQATSRIGRQLPGLVLVMYNAAKSRDLSHYETFRDVHTAMYRGVESSSVTPFAVRARDRALHAVFVTLARHLIPELGPNRAAADVSDHGSAVASIKESIIRRVQNVPGSDAEAVARELDEIHSEWIARAAGQAGLVYRADESDVPALLGAAADLVESDSPIFPTLWSLRDVDRSAPLIEATRK